VKWANLEPISPKLPPDSVHQKLLKSAYFWPSYSKN